jgi:hypothetical protein
VACHALPHVLHQAVHGADGHAQIVFVHRPCVQLQPYQGEMFKPYSGETPGGRASGAMWVSGQLECHRS